MILLSRSLIIRTTHDLGLGALRLLIVVACKSYNAVCGCSLQTLADLSNMNPITASKWMTKPLDAGFVFESRVNRGRSWRHVLADGGDSVEVDEAMIEQFGDSLPMMILLTALSDPSGHFRIERKTLMVLAHQSRNTMVRRLGDLQDHGSQGRADAAWFRDRGSTFRNTSVKNYAKFACAEFVMRKSKGNGSVRWRGQGIGRVAPAPRDRSSGVPGARGKSVLFVEPRQVLDGSVTRRLAAFAAEVEGNDSRVLFVPFNVASCPATALSICFEHGRLRLKLEQMTPEQAEIAYLLTIPRAVLEN